MTRHPRLYPRIYRPDFLTLTGLRMVLSDELAGARGTVVDYGCGSQPYRALIPKSCDYVGADFPGVGPGAIVLDHSGRVPLADGTADTVLSTQVLEHVRDVDGYLRECHRLLKPMGVLILTTHGNWPYHPYLTEVEDYWRWTGAGLRALAEKNGFRVARVRPSCAGKLSLVQQLLALHDPARRRLNRPRRWLRAGWCLGWNVAACAAERVAPKWTRSGDLLPVDFLLVAERT